MSPKHSLVANGEYALFFDSPPLPDSMRLLQDIHAGAFEAAEMGAFFPEDVNREVARTLPSSASFGRWAERVASSMAEAIARFLKERQTAQ